MEQYMIGVNKPSTYLQTIQNQGIPEEKLDAILESHLVDPALLRTDDFDHFIQTRAGQLLTLIEQAMGKTISGRDSDEVYSAFGGII